MRFSELKKEVITTRNDMDKAISLLAEKAIDDSETYLHAIEKLKGFRWSLNGELSTLIIDTAIERVTEKALKGNC